MGRGGGKNQGRGKGKPSGKLNYVNAEQLGSASDVVSGTLWYVSNVSIIFDAPCLFLHHLLSISLHFVAFLCIFRN
jgi:hypothetical protein